MAFTKKRSGSETRKRGPLIAFRASEEERAAIQAAADRAGLTVGSYVRSCALKSPTTRAVRRPPVQTAQLAQLLGLMGKAGGDLQRIAASMSADDALGSGIDMALQEFREAASAIMRLMGRKPLDH